MKWKIITHLIADSLPYVVGQNLLLFG